MCLSDNLAEGDGVALERGENGLLAARKKGGANFNIKALFQTQRLIKYKTVMKPSYFKDGSS